MIQNEKLIREHRVKRETDMTISQKIFALMDIRHMTLKEFSEKAGISMSTIRDWKIKNTNPSSEKILKICQALQIKPQVLLSEEEIDEAETVDEDGIKVDYDIIVNQDEKLLLEIYRKANSAQKNRIMGYIDAMATIIK